ncbi:gas vesicle protein [Streptomyces sp. NPDC002587]
MTEPLPGRLGGFPSRAAPMAYGQSSTSSLADILERVLDKGIVIAGDIRINLLDIELLTIKLRILIASVDKAKEMGIDWWEHDPSLSSRHTGSPLEQENRRLRAELEALRRESADERVGELEGEPEPPERTAPDEESRGGPARKRTRRRPQ